MARVTIEDCFELIPNRFEIVVLAAQRAREISAGAQLTVDRDRDKNPVVSLREIAEKTVDLDTLRDVVVLSNQSRVEANSMFGEEREGTLLPITVDDDPPPAEELDLVSLTRKLAAQAGDCQSRDE